MMKRVFIFFILCSNLWAYGTKNINFDFSTGLALSNGNTSEFVYYPNGDVMSRLDWKEYCTPSITLKGDLNVYHTVLTCEYFTAIPVKLGIMEDRDYLNADRSRVSHYSTSDLIINKNYKLKVLLGYELMVNKFKILPQLGFCYQNKKYEACDGYYQYGPNEASNGGYWSSSLTKHPMYGTCMTYEQQYFIPSINLKTTYILNDSWSFLLYGSYSPYIKVDAADFHCATQEKMIQYNDYMDNGYGFSIGLGSEYKRVGLFLEYEYMEAKEGCTYQRQVATGKSYTRSSTTPGTESSIFTMKAMYRFE